MTYLSIRLGCLVSVFMLIITFSESYFVGCVGRAVPSLTRRCFPRTPHKRRIPRYCNVRSSTTLLNDLKNFDDYEVDTSFADLASGDDSGSGPASRWCKLPFDKMVFPKTKYNKDDFQIMEKVDLRPITSPYKPSPVEVVTVRGKEVYVKRDDLLRLENSNVSGNKARKMFALNQIPAEAFPKHVVSYGGSQSNAMLALAAVVQSKNMDAMGLDRDPENDGEEGDMQDDTEESQQRQGLPEKRFIYYSKKLPRFLRKNPSGNYFRAKTLGMEMIELSNDEYNTLFGGDSGGKPDAPVGLETPVDGESVWVSLFGYSHLVTYRSPN